jgi:hypothetical protein
MAKGIGQSAWREAKGIEQRAERMALISYLGDFLKLVIFRLSLSSFSNILLSILEVMRFLRFSNMIMFAFSKVDLRAMFKNCINSFLGEEPAR